MTPSEIIARLEEAGSTLLAADVAALPDDLRHIRTAAGVGAGNRDHSEHSAPSAERIARMKESLDWLKLIPRDRYVLRRIVGIRSLVHPITGEHLFPWRRLSAILGADRLAVQRWHAQGIAFIAAALDRSAA